MGVFDSNLGVVKNQMAARGIPTVRSLDDVLRQQKLVTRPLNRTMPAPVDLSQVSGASAKNAGGWEGFLADIMGSVPGKIITAPLTVLSVPGKVIPSILKEMKDALDNNPDTQASWGELASQLVDPSFGFGTVTGNLTGIKWIDRAIGFAGDVLLDPLTYATLGASRALRVVDSAGNVVKGKRTLSIASRDGRIAMGQRFRELGADDLTVKNIVRRGRSAVADKDMLAKAGYDRAGIYWMGKRVPHTTRAGEALERGLTGFRVWAGDHIFNRVADLFTPLDMEDARRMLARGSAPTEKVGDLMNMVLSRNEERAVEQANKRLAGQLRFKHFSNVTEQDIKAGRASAYKYIDVNPLPATTATPEGRLAIATRTWLDDLHERVKLAGLETDPEFDLNYLNNYLPYMVKDEGWRWMANTNNPAATMAKGQTFDVFEPTGAFKSRRAVGEKIGNHRLTPADIDGGVDRMNEIYRREFNLNFDFFETDLPTILIKYENMYAGMMGKIARKKFISERGTFKRLSDRLITDPELEKTVQKQLNKVVKERSKRQKSAAASLDEVVSTARSILDGEVTRVSSDIADVTKRYSDSLIEEGALSYKQSLLINQLSVAKEELSESFNIFQRSIEGAGDNMIIAAMDNRIESLLDEIDSIADEVNNLNFAESIQESQIKPILERIEKISKELKSAIQSEEDIIKRGNVIAEHFESILYGKDIQGSKKLSEDIRNSVRGNIKPPRGGESTVIGEPKFQRAIKGFEGEERELKIAELRSQGMYTGVVNEPWWAEIQQLEPISMSKVEDYSKKKNLIGFLQQMTRGGGDKGKYGSTASLEEMRAAGIALVGWIDSLPPSMASNFYSLKEDLIEGVKMASQSTNYYKKLNRVRKGNNGVVTLGGIVDNYDTVVSESRLAFFRYFAAEDLLNRVFSKVELNTMSDQLVPTAYIQRIVSQEEFRSLADYFEPILMKRTDRSVDSFDEIQSLMNASYSDQYDDAFDRGVRGKVVGGRYDSGSDFAPSSMTYGQLSQLLESVKKESLSATYELKFKTNTLLDGELVNLGETIAKETGFDPGTGVLSIGDLIRDYQAPWKAAFEGKVQASRNRAVDSVVAQSEYMQGIFKPFREWRESVNVVLRKNGINPNDRKAIQLFDENLAKKVSSAKRDLAAGKISKEEMKDSISSAKEEFSAAVDDDLRPGEVLSADEANERLSSLILKTYFTLEVESRWTKLVKQMTSEGLTLGKDTYRAVFNAVAKDLSEHASSRVRTFDFARRQLDEVLDFIDGSGMERERLLGIISDPQSLPDQVKLAKSELRNLPDSNGWIGREEDLYEGISKMLRREGPQWHEDWREVVSIANGRHDVDTLLIEARYWGGADSSAGVADKIRKARQRLAAAVDPDEIASIEMEIAVLPTKKEASKQRRLLLEKKLRPWYKANINASAENPSWAEIYSELKKYKGVAKSGGVLDPTASVKQMRDWVKTAQKNLARYSERTRKNYAWTLEASDPFVDPLNFTIGVGSKQELPSVYALSLKRVADELEIDLSNLDKAQATAAKVAAELAAAEPVAAEAERALRELTRPGGRVAGFVPDDQVDMVKFARELHNKVAETKSSKPWVSAVERSELNDIITALSQYAAIQRTDLSYEVAAKDIAAEMSAEGQTIFYQKAATNPEVQAEMSRLQKEIAQITSVFAAAEGSLAEAGNFKIDEVLSLIKSQPGKYKKVEPFRKQYEELMKQGKVDDAERVLMEGVKFLPKKTFRGIYSGTNDLVKYERSIEERIKFASMKYERDVKMRRLSYLTENNPIVDAPFKQAKDPSGLKNGVVYYYMDPKSTISLEDIEKRYRRAASLRRKGLIDEATKIETEIRGAMKPILPRKRVLRVGDKNISLGPDDFRGLFDDVNEFVVDVAEDGTVRQFSLKDIALQNTSDLLQMIKNGDLNKEDLINALSYTSRSSKGTIYPVAPDVYAARKKVLDDAWEKSPDKALLDEINIIENSHTMASYRALLRDKQKAIDTAEKLRQQSRQALGEVGSPNAPYGFEPFNIGVASKFFREERARYVLQEQQRLMRDNPTYMSESMAWEIARNKAITNEPMLRKVAGERAKAIPRKEPVVGTKGATYRFNKTFNKLNGIFEGIKRSVGDIYDPYRRFNDITANGTSYGDAINTILKEIEELRPPDQNFVDIATSARKYVEQAETLRYQLAFLNSNVDNDTVGRWVYGSAGMSPSDTFRFGAAAGVKEMDSIGKEVEQLDKLRVETLRKVMQPSYEDSTKAISSGEKKIKKLEESLSKMSVLFDNAALAKMDLKKQQDLVVPMLQRRVDNMNNALERLDKIVASDASLEAKHAELTLWLAESEDLLAELGTIATANVRPDAVITPGGMVDPTMFFKAGPDDPGGVVDPLMFLKSGPDTPGGVLDPPLEPTGVIEKTKDYEKFLTVKAAYLNSWNEMAVVDDFYNEALKTIQSLKDGEWGKIIPKELEKGWTTLEQLGLPSFYASEEMYEMTKNMQQFIEPEFVRGMNRFLGRYTGFFKAYVTSTPGFVVRNTMSNSFMLVASGVKLKNMIEGLELYRSWRSALKNGSEEKFLESLSKKNGDIRELFDLAVRSSDAAGYGRGAEAFAGWNPKRKIVSDNRYTTFFKNWNESSEGSARFMMAYDSAVRGDDFNTAVARVKKYFFDYQDVSGPDRALRSVVPFWYWMSRNLPLQLTNRWANPKAYLMYDKIMRAVRDDEDDQFAPSWMIRAGAVRIGDGAYLMPDLGFSRINEDIMKLANPFSGEFLDMVNPGLKVPIEMITNTRLKYGNQFGEEGVQPGAGPFSPAVQALAEIMGPFGQSRPTPQGGMGVTEKFDYAARSLLPMLGQAERIAPSSEGGQSKIANSWLSYLGVPIRTVTNQDRQKERDRQIYEQNDLRQRAERGY
jgi:hypothetical protein